MKALKEKRISLRSLWRRSLVILSLLALVFASCADSSSSDKKVDETKMPLSLSILDEPANPSYQGLKVDLTGIRVLVRYNTGPLDYEILTDPSVFDTLPRYATGYYSAGTFTERDEYALLYNYGSKTNVFLPTGANVTVSVIGIQRSNTTVDGPDFPSPPNYGTSYWAQGVQLTGLQTMRTRKLYVDDYPDFTGLVCEADYENATKQIIPLTRDMDWEIRPRYDNGTETGTGDLLITVGRNSYGNSNMGLPADRGVTVMAPLEAVYHVTGIEIISPPELDPFFYWKSDDSEDWLDRCKDSKFRATYSNGGTREFTVAEALMQNNVYYNMNPDPTMLAFAIEGISRTGVVLGTVGAADVSTNRNPQILYYYRGHRATVKVPVFTRLTGLSVVSASGNQILVDMLKRDNDYLPVDSVWFSKLITVVATFTAFSDPTLPAAALTLEFDKTCTDVNYEDASDTESYTMNFGKADSRREAPYLGDGWGVCDLTGNNNRTRPVSIYYRPEGGTVRTARIQCDWINISGPH